MQGYIELTDTDKQTNKQTKLVECDVLIIPKLDLILDDFHRKPRRLPE